MDPRLSALMAEFADIERRLASNPPLEELKTISRRHRELAALAARASEVSRLEHEIAELDELLRSPDKELADLARAERPRIEEKIGGIESAILRDLEQGSGDSRNAFLEVRAGAGGEEAALFAADLLRLYRRFAETRGWKAEIVDVSTTGLKGIKQATLYIQGPDVFSWLKWEGGVHRVQRVPKTEAAGRIHTSTATVAVLPEVEEEGEVPVRPEDLKIDTYRAGGHGGQNVNKVETAIRITHLPSGIVVQCQDERSQLKNKLKALKILQAKLGRIREETAKAGESEERRKQVGSADRSEKIRTYNFPQNRLTDHRLERSWFNLPAIMEGDIGPSPPARSPSQAPQAPLS